MFHQGLSGRFELRIRFLDEVIPQNVSCLHIFSGTNWQKFYLWRLFSLVKPILFKISGWFFAIKISPDSFKFSRGGSEKQIGP